jgi:predicted amidophosphoribosyltransferase
MLIALYIPYKRIISGKLVPFSTSKTPSQSDRFCPNCGKVIAWDAQTCPYCGKRFEK